MKWIFLILLSCEVSIAQHSSRGFRSTKIGFAVMNFTGTANRSFSNGNAGYGLEISTDSGGTYFRYFVKGRFIYADGSQSFLNGSSTFTSNYKFSEFAPELGFILFPVARREDGMNLYLFGLGNISYNYLELATVPSGSAILAKDQAFGVGYGGGVGFEYVLGSSRGGNKKLIFGEVGFRDERTTLAKTSNFEISGMNFSIGFGF